MAKSISQVTIDFLQMPLTKVYELYKVVVAEIKVREITLVKQVKKSQKVVDKTKRKMQEME